jgi:hypothetical protein
VSRSPTSRKDYRTPAACAAPGGGLNGGLATCGLPPDEETGESIGTLYGGLNGGLS